MKSRLLLALGLCVSVGSQTSCGGGDSGSGATAGTGALDASSVSNASSTFNALEGLLDNVDGASTSSKLSARAQMGPQGPQPGDFSAMGCHYKQDKKRAFRQLKHIQSPLCHMSIVEENNADFVIPEESYGYYRLLGFGKGEGEAGEGLLRVGVFTDGDGKRSLKFQMCEQGAQQEDFRLSEVEGGISAFTAHVFSFVDPTTSETHEGKGSFSVEAFGETAEEMTKAVVNARFKDDFGAGSVDVTADRVEELNSMLGRFSFSNDQFSNDNAVCIFASKGEGSGKFEGTATFPAWEDANVSPSRFLCPPDQNSTTFEPVEVAQGDSCTQSFAGTEDFEFIPGDPPLCVIDGEPNAGLQAKVADCELPAQAVEPSSFEETWDCTGEFVDIDLSTLEEKFADCRQYEDFGEEFDNCQLEAAKDQGTPN